MTMAPPPRADSAGAQRAGLDDMLDALRFAARHEDFANKPTKPPATGARISAIRVWPGAGERFGSEAEQDQLKQVDQFTEGDGAGGNRKPDQ